jgi:carotenoid cleavage dioxygenase-like enzyme
MPSPVARLLHRTLAGGAMRVAAFNRARLAVPQQPHPFLSGIHAPMGQELTLENLPVEGRIPVELDGRYLRIGPNPVTPPHPGAYHWFVGDGMVHGVRLQGGRALWYRNRWVRSQAVSAALGEPPAPGVRHGGSDTVNTNILGHAGRTWACVEAGAYPVEMGEELATVAHNPFGGSLQGSFSAHPHRDPVSGELHAICYDGRIQNQVRHVVVDRAGRVRREEPIAVAHGPSIHDCMITPSYVLVLDLPVTFSLKTLLAGHAFPYTWNPDHPARVGVLPLEGRGSDIVWCTVDPCYVFHPCNAFETTDGQVIVDVVAHASMFADSTQGPDSRQSAFERWTIDPVRVRCSAVCWTPSRRSFRAATSGAPGGPTGTPTPCRWRRKARRWVPAPTCSSTICTRGNAHAMPSAHSSFRVSSYSCPGMPTRPRTMVG